MKKHSESWNNKLFIDVWLMHFKIVMPCAIKNITAQLSQSQFFKGRYIFFETLSERLSRKQLSWKKGFLSLTLKK